MDANPLSITSVSTAKVPRAALPPSVVDSADSPSSFLPQIGSLKSRTPSMRAISALHLVHEYWRPSIIVEHIAVDRILHWAKIVNMPAEMFRRLMKLRMFIDP
ncbi:unnamed protein product [Pseudo-nitzschia multistriata]|uniref:Uncharacterized protein n=1 Tax=Pseudo-nitzschia multistriata TaxID=183589 RepID=A0A448ZQ95_9STRA|nr:unnamed protein product [Pseudo-nitzschia multistriata]